ncbi:MAG TPA: thioredoxin family protein [Cytophagales bacterium]|nr:thioredoxin family protein [Cytophagales bacterium]
MIYKKLVLFFIAMLFSLYLYPQEYKVGSIIKDFKLLDVTGKTVSLSDYKNAKGFIIVFTSNTCPFSKLYEERLNKLSLKYQQTGFPVIVINANDPAMQPGESFDNMKLKAEEKQFVFPYLFDEGQKVTTLFYPLKTPHAFVVTRESNNYKIVYSGAIDDSPSNAATVKVNFVENAVDELLAGKKVSISTSKPIGCTVKWKKG